MAGPDEAADGAAGTPLDAWLERVRAELGATSPALPQAERAALLELTRLAAHASQRVAGPLTVYALGMTVAGMPSQRRLERIRELTARLAAPA